MQKWEYLRVEMARDARVGSVYANGVRVFPGTGIKDADFQDYLNKLGSEGWEMVGWNIIQGTIYEKFYFKRQLN